MNARNEVKPVAKQPDMEESFRVQNSCTKSPPPNGYPHNTMELRCKQPYKLGSLHMYVSNCCV